MKRYPTFAYADDREDDLHLFKMAFDRAGLTNPLVLLHGSQEVHAYLQGVDQFANRAVYPLPSILFLDYKMPESNGIQLTRWVRARPQFKKLVILLFSGSGQQEDIETAYAAGVNAYITKPQGMFRLSAVLKTVHSFWCDMASLPHSLADRA